MTPDSNFLEDLNRPQQEAVAHPGGPLMVIAGAGSGKTRVITYRIAGLIRRSVPRDRILAITFTNKAAREMRDRAERLVGPGDLWISTFHSFCARILRRHIDRIPPYTSKFSIYDRDDQVSLLRSILPDLDIDPRLRPPALFLRIIGRAKNELRGPDELAQSGRMRGPGREEALRVYRAYEGALRDRNALDFDDLLLLTVRLFEGAPDVAAFYQEKFLHLLVDEYQDTNHAQYRLGEILSARHRNITITGDPDQSIYAWRGADIRNILRFEEDFPDARIVKLEQNYRSTKRILAAAQGLIAHNKERKEKDLWTQNPEGVPVRVVCATDPSDEGRRVAEAIAVRARAGASYGECAVFYRVNAQSRSIEMALFDAGIPYVVVGGVAFYARREIKDLLAYLRAAVNPRDDESLKRIINVPARGIGQKSLERLREWARERGVPLREALDAGESIEGIPARAAGAARILARLLDEIGGTGSEGRVAARIADLVERIDYRRYLRETEPTPEEADDRLQNVDELIGGAAEFDGRNPEGGLDAFLQEVALLTDVDRWEQRAEQVNLMTLHSAKGLEFRTVFICGVEDGYLPLRRSADDDDGRDDWEEERRLLYVGMTRAKEELTLLWSQLRSRWGQMNDQLPSPFLEEIPREHLSGPTGRAEGRGSRYRIEDEEGDGDVDRSDMEAIRPGVLVRHERFGVGRVLAVSGSGRTRRASLVFERGGRKEMVLAYARLEVLGAVDEIDPA